MYSLYLQSAQSITGIAWKYQDRSSVKLHMAMRKLYSIGFTLFFFILSLPSMRHNAHSCGIACGAGNDAYTIHCNTVAVKDSISKKYCCGTQESSCDLKRDAGINRSEFIISNVKIKVYPPPNTGILLTDFSPGLHAIKRRPAPHRATEVPVIPLYIQNVSLIF